MVGKVTWKTQPQTVKQATQNMHRHRDTGNL